MTERALFDPAKVKLGVVPTIWTNDDMPLLGDSIPFEQCASEIALAGIRGTALGHKLPTDAAALRRALELRGLEVCAAWVGLYFTANEMRRQTLDEFDRQADFLRSLGATDVVVAAAVTLAVQLRKHAPPEPARLLPGADAFFYLDLGRARRANFAQGCDIWTHGEPKFDRPASATHAPPRQARDARPAPRNPRPPPPAEP